MIYNEPAFKKATKNLNKELSTLGFELSHGATLNLLARTLGFNDYNTIKPSLVTQENISKKMNHSLNNIEMTNKEIIQKLSYLESVTAEPNDEITKFINKLNRRKPNNFEVSQTIISNEFPLSVNKKPGYSNTNRHGGFCYSYSFSCNDNDNVYEFIGTFLKEKDYYHTYFLIINGKIISLFDEHNTLNSSDMGYFDDKMIELIFEYFDFNENYPNSNTIEEKRDIVETHFMGYKR